MCMGMEKCVCVECVGGVHVCERKCMYCMSVDLYIRTCENSSVLGVVKF